MSTILGPAPCRDCRTHVWVVRRTAEVPCRPTPCDWEDDPRLPCTCKAHTHAIRDVAWTVVNADGERHICEAASNR